MMGDPHIGFIVAAYAVAAATIGAMIGWVVLDFRRLSTQLARRRAPSTARAGPRAASAHERRG